MRRRRDAGRVDLLDTARVLENLAELSRERLDLGLGEFETGERRDALDLLSTEDLGHAEC